MLSERFGVKIKNDGSYIRHRHKLFTLIIDQRNREVRYYKNFYELYNSEKAKKNLENIEKMYKTQEDFIKEKFCSLTLDYFIEYLNNYGKEK